MAEHHVKVKMPLHASRMPEGWYLGYTEDGDIAWMCDGTIVQKEVLIHDALNFIIQDLMALKLELLQAKLRQENLAQAEANMEFNAELIDKISYGNEWGFDW